MAAIAGLLFFLGCYGFWELVGKPELQRQYRIVCPSVGVDVVVDDYHTGRHGGGTWWFQDVKTGKHYAVSGGCVATVVETAKAGE